MDAASRTLASGFPARMSMAPGSTARLRDFRSWKDFVHDNFPWLEHRDHSVGRFEAEVSAYRFGCGALSTISAGASEVIRTRHLAEASEAGFIKLMWQMSGEMRVDQDGRQALIEAGCATVCDTARAYRIRLSEDSHFAVFMLPYESCPGWEHISPKICGLKLAADPSLRAALGALMGLASLPQDENESDNQTVVQAVQWMLSASLHRCARGQGLPSMRNARLSKARTYILEHLSDAGLGADELAAALCMSRRSLYLLFKAHDLSPARMIQDLRLEQGGRMLADVGQQHRKITDIAFDLGFSDYATFSRLFKLQYGVTPSEYRLGLRAPRQ